MYTILLAKNKKASYRDQQIDGVSQYYVL